MHKNNSRNKSKFKDFSQIQLSCNLTRKCNSVGYYSYTHRCKTFLTRPEKYYDFLPPKKLATKATIPSPIVI